MGDPPYLATLQSVLLNLTDEGISKAYTQFLEQYLGYSVLGVTLPLDLNIVRAVHLHNVSHGDKLLARFSTFSIDSTFNEREDS